MRVLSSSNSVRFDAKLFLLIWVAWTALFVYPDLVSVLHTLERLFFAFGAAVFSFLILRFLGYFDPIRILPRKSDILLVLFAVPCGGLSQYFIFNHLIDLNFQNFYELLIWSPSLAIAVFWGHFALERFLLGGSPRKRVVLDLTPAEKAKAMWEFADLGMAQHIEFLSPYDLRSYFKEGQEHSIDLIVVSKTSDWRLNSSALLIRAHLAGIPIVDRSEIFISLTGRVRLSDVDLCSYFISATPQTAFLRAFVRFKLILEPIVAALLLLALSPLMLTIGLIVKCSSPGPALFRQLRVGYYGQNFLLYKFRSMPVDAERDGPVWASKDDRRVTRLGRFLRRSRLDELPQLINIIRGEMSFFGPRPERPEIYEKLNKKIPLFSLRALVKPGITGWAQVCAGYAASVAESQLKLEYDLFYIRNRSPRLDFIILVKTILVIIAGAEYRPQRRPVATVSKPDDSDTDKPFKLAQGE